MCALREAPEQERRTKRDLSRRLFHRLIGAARSGLLVAADPNDPDRRVLASTKCNLARRPTSLLYRIESDDESQSLRLTWEGTSDLTCDNLLVTVEASRPDTLLERSVEFLQAQLRAGPVAPTRLLADGERLGLNIHVLRKAADRLGVEHRREVLGRGSRVLWSLPSPSHTSLPD